MHLVALPQTTLSKVTTITGETFSTRISIEQIHAVFFGQNKITIFQRSFRRRVTIGKLIFSVSLCSAG